MSLKTFQSGLIPIGHFDVRDTDLPNIKGGEVLVFDGIDADVFDRAASDILQDGYRTVLRLADETDEGPFFLANLADDTNGSFPGFETTSLYGKQRPFAKALDSSGKVAVYAQDGFYSISGDALDLTGLGPTTLPGTVLYVNSLGQITTSNSPSNAVVGFFVEYRSSTQSKGINAKFTYLGSHRSGDAYVIYKSSAIPSSSGGSGSEVANIAERNALAPLDREVVRVQSTGELFVYDGEREVWVHIPNSSTRPDFFYRRALSDSPIIYVSSTVGSDVNGEGTESSPFASVARALDSIPHGYKSFVYVLVAQGTYEDSQWVLPRHGSSSITEEEVPSAFPGTPQISVRMWDQGQGELIQLVTANGVRTSVPHPSGQGNYLSLHSYSFPPFNTAIGINDTPEHFLVARGSGLQFSTAVLTFYKGTDNITGSVLGIGSAANITVNAEAEYRILSKDDLPVFTRLRLVSSNFPSSNAQVTVNLLRFETSSLKVNHVTFAACVFASSFFNMVFLEYTAVSRCIFERTTGSSNCLINFNSEHQQVAFSPMFANYFFNVTVTNTGTYSPQLINGVFESTVPMPVAKLIIGSVLNITNYNVGSSAYSPTFWNSDFIGPGTAIAVIGAQPTQGSNLSFDGVGTPVLLNNKAVWSRRSGIGFGTCTQPVTIRLGSQVVASSPTNDSGVAMSTWTISNTANPGHDIKVGGLGPVAYTDLPVNDFGLNVYSQGCFAR